MNDKYKAKEQPTKELEALRRRVVELERSEAERKQAKEELREAHNKLEKRVRERTIELSEAYKQLEQELDERKRAEVELLQLNEILRLIRNINQLILQIDNEPELLQKACDRLTEDGSYRLAWIGLTQEGSPDVLPVAQAGFEDSYLSSVKIKWDDSEYGRGPTGKAIKTGQPAIMRDILNDPKFRPWREQALKRGYGSSIALPLKIENKVIGALNVYSRHPDAFDDAELSLLVELAGDISLGIEKIRRREERQRAEEALKKSESTLAEAQRMAHIGSWELDLVSNTLTWSDEIYQMFGLEPQQFEATYEAFLDNIHPDDREMVNKAYTESVRTKNPYNIVHRLLLKDGTIKYVNERCETFYGDDGKPVRSIGTVQDITERKRTEEELHRQIAFVRLLEKVAIIANQALSVEDALQLALDLVCAHKGWPVGHVYILAGDSTDKLAPTTIWHLEKAEKFETFRKVTEVTCFTSGVGLPGRVLATGKPAWIVDVTKDPNFPRAKLAKELGVKAGFAFPVLAGTEVVAVLEFFSAEAEEPDGALLELMGLIGTQLGRVVERKKAEEELARLASFPELNPDPIIEIDRDGVVTYLNPAAGREFPDLLTAGGKHPLLIGLRSALTTLQSGKKKSLRREIEFGGKVYEQHISYIHESRRLRGYVSDITERKQAEEKMKHAAEEWRTTFDSITDWVFICDKDFKLVRVNKAFADAFKMKPEELISRHCYEIVHGTNEPLPNCPHKKTLETKKPATAETFVPHLGMHLELSTSPIFDEKGEVVASVHLIRDITERKRRDEELREHREHLEEMVKERTRELEAVTKTAELSSQAKSDFLASMSHELRTPLNAVIGFSQVLQEQYFGKLNEKQAEYVNDILESGRHLLDLINDVLDLSKIEAGRVELELSSVYLKQLLENSLIMIREKALKHQIRLELNMAPDLEGLKIRADGRRLKQVMFNLLSNAAKFTPDGGAITLEGRREGKELVISVSDTGVGIPPGEQEKIFGEFYQVSSGIKGKAPGTGLGLSLARRLVEMHGGRLWAESAGVGKGSRFTFTLPIRRASRAVKGRSKSR